MLELRHRARNNLKVNKLPIKYEHYQSLFLRCCFFSDWCFLRSNLSKILDLGMRVGTRFFAGFMASANNLKNFSVTSSLFESWLLLCEESN